MSTDSVEPVTPMKKDILGGHKVHLGKLISSVSHLLQDNYSERKQSYYLENCRKREKRR